MHLSEHSAYVRRHIFSTDECERRGKKFQLDLMQNRIRQHNMQYRDKPKEPTNTSKPPAFSAKLKPIVREDELHDEEDEDLLSMIEDLSNNNDESLCTSDVGMHQEHDNFSFQDENFIRVSNNNAGL